jgi:predicted O-linked N-acetylglucosamine transferase (SPINDLY family)
MDLQTLAAEAVALHQQGKLAEAERLYNHILDAEPGLFGPYFYLGLMRLQQGRNAEAADLLAQALQITPTDLGALMNHGMALRAAGRPDEALKSFDGALAIKPDMAEGHYNRGVVLTDLRRYEMAIEAYDRALVLQPEFLTALINRGVAQGAISAFDDALASYDAVLRMQPSNAMALNGRALILMAQMKFDDAVATLEKALAASPDHGQARYNLAVALLNLGRFTDALAHFDSAMLVNPNDSELLNNRSVALWNLKRPAEALAGLDRALAVEPHFVEAWGNRGLVLKDLGRLEEALASYDMVLTYAPRNAAAFNMRGNVLRELKRIGEAIDSYSKALEIRTAYAEALNNRGYTYWADLHDYMPALADLEQALKLEPDHPYVLGEVLHLKMYGADWSDYDARKAELLEQVRQEKRAARPFMFQAVSESPRDSQTCSQTWARDMYVEVEAPRHVPATRPRHDKICIGYVSGEFREQATQILMAGVYEAHDRNRFEITAIDNGGPADDAMRKRLEKTFDHWLDISRMSDEDAAAAIRAAGIDILVNLNGYFGKPRMGVFARRPAPVQVNYLGFPATLGARYIDYIIADAVVIPAGEHAFYDEKVVTLPGSYQANDNRGRAIAAVPTRAEAGLPHGAFVFCNFNNAYKLTPDTFAGWMRILKAVPHSVLWLLDSREPFPTNIRKRAADAGVDPARILFAPDRAPADHLARLSLADLFLDSLPYNAHTTASDALWAGVPLLTRRGTTFPGRVAASLLAAAGLPELITETAGDYEKLAIKLATDTAAITQLRDMLKKNRADCALFDTPATTRALEAAYAQMWTRWQAGEAPAAFSV